MSVTATTETPAPRKFPPPCWTRDEALALIEAYKDRWYALRRGYLRSADWDAVAEVVAQNCPAAESSPPKTSAQCRHKMEKLRQRYRAEKQRAVSCPGKFLSSWFFFDNMDLMENPNGSSTPEITIDQLNNSSANNAFQLKTLIDHNLVKLAPNSKNNKAIIDANSNPNFGKNNPNFGSRVLNGSPSYMEVGDDRDLDDEIDYGAEFHVKKSRNFGRVYGNSRAKFGYDQDGGNNSVDVSCGYRGENPSNQDLGSSGFGGKKFGKVDRKLNAKLDCYGVDENGCDEDGGFWVKIPSNKRSVPAGFRGKYSGRNDGNLHTEFGSNDVNGFYSSSRLGFGEKSGSGGGGVKRARDPVEEIVSSIKLLGDGFVKMEKMKMEMAREIEKMRMEMEMKRNELILESQKQIVDAFVKVLFENKKAAEAAATTTTTTVAPES